MCQYFRAFCMHLLDNSRPPAFRDVRQERSSCIVRFKWKFNSKTPIVRRMSIYANLSFHRFAFLVMIRWGGRVSTPTASETHTRVAWSCSLRDPKGVARRSDHAQKDNSWSLIRFVTVYLPYFTCTHIPWSFVPQGRSPQSGSDWLTGLQKLSDLQERKRLKL